MTRPPNVRESRVDLNTAAKRPSRPTQRASISTDRSLDTTTMTENINLLLVDDDDVAAESAVRNLKKNGVTFPIHTATDGEAALRALRGDGPDGKLSGSTIVLLDLNMPGMDGFEFLEELRRDPKLRPTVVFVLTTSDSETDRTRAYHELIAGYIVKSAVGQQFSNLASLLHDYGTTVRLP